MAWKKVTAGRIPAQEMMEGIVLAVSGALLLTPGLLPTPLAFWVYCLFRGFI